MIYRFFRTLSRLALHLFFRRIDIEARYNIPPVGPLLFVPNHTNALVDPLVLMGATRREITITAKNVLGHDPFLRTLMKVLGVVTFHRREDVGRGAELRKNVQSLRRCREILTDGGAVCVFPEGISHSDPRLREFHVGPARIALDFVRKDGNPGRLRIVPVGLLYTEKDRFRSGVWLRFGRPIDVSRWLEANPAAGAAELTAELRRQVGRLTLNYESRRESAILAWAADIVSTGGRRPSPLGGEERTVDAWFRMVGRLQVGYRKLLESEPSTIRDLTRRVRRYRAVLKRAAIAPEEVYLPIHAGRAAFFVVRELELVVVGAPLALFGVVNHVIPYQLVKAIARRMSTDKDHWASNVVYPGMLVFPACYIVQIALAWGILPSTWAGLYTLALPYTGYYALHYGDRLKRSWRRTVTYLRFLLNREEQVRLALEGRAIVESIRELGARVESDPEGSHGPEPEVRDRTGSGPLFALSATDLRAQFRDDVTTLRDVLDGLDRLEAEWDEARWTIQARNRGYFTPDEDDRTRRMLLAYRNYRLVLYEIVDRYLDHEQLEERRDQLCSFMIAYSAGLTLYSRSMKLIRAYEHQPLIRRKLNEPDASFGLGAGFFEEILRAYTSLHNYRLLAGCSRFWWRHRRELRAPELRADPDWSWLAAVIRREQAAVRSTFWLVLCHRLAYDRRALARVLSRPVHRANYGLRAFVAGTLAPRHTTPWYEPAIVPEILARLGDSLRPGDILMIRTERKFTTALLPGFWCHTALYLGGRADLERNGIGESEPARTRLVEKAADPAPYGYVIEAVSPRVAITPLQGCLRADHVLVLRPILPDEELRSAILEACRHLGKPYDFEFDFNVTTRIVCTELIYRCYHGRGGLTFPLVKRLGRYTLSCDDIVGWYLDRHHAARAGEGVPPPIRAVTMVLQGADHRAHFVAPELIDATLRGLRTRALPAEALQAVGGPASAHEDAPST